VAVEYFMKWIEAKPLTNISSATIRKFFWQNIICCYGFPHHITVNNTKYFDNTMFKDFCQQIRTKVTFALVYHPQSNDAVERVNALIFKAIKKILEGEKKGKWAEVMPKAVWSHNTMPFWLMYGADTMLPEEVKHRSLRMKTNASACPSEAQEKDLLESDRLNAVENLQKYQEETKAWIDPNVKLQEFDLGNLVLL
jgi:hypothetical protein